MVQLRWKEIHSWHLNDSREAGLELPELIRRLTPGDES